MIRSYLFQATMLMATMMLLGKNLSTVDAFTSRILRKKIQRLDGATRLCDNLKSGFGGDDGSVERARKLLSQAWDKDVDNGTKNNKNDGINNHHIPAKKLIQLLVDSNVAELDNLLPSPPPLTTAERDRRFAELKLLEQLASSDEATRELMDLWSAERGAQAQERLVHAAGMLEAGQVIAAENMLVKLIDDYGISWVEPLNRLATVYFRQGRFQDCYALCEAVLHLKPWHFGALDGIVTVSMRLCDRDKARNWAQKGLPRLVASTSFPPFATTGAANPQRAQWVHTAIQQAQEALSHLEYRTQKRFLGAPEEYYNLEANNNNQQLAPKQEANLDQPEEDNESDAWQ